MKTIDSPPVDDLAAIVHAGGSHHHRWVRYLVLLGIIALVGGGWFWWTQKVQGQSQGPAFATEPVKKGDINLTITATGNLEPTNKVTVGSELSGTTLEVYLDTNDRVTKGQPLAKLDTTKLTQQTESSRASVNSAKAKVSQVEATLKESEASLARLKELHRLSGGQTPSRLDMDTAIASAERALADLASAKAAVGEAEAQVRINENDLSKAIIRSPIDGIVLTRSVEPGQTVAASFTAPELFVIAEKLEFMELLVKVAEADIGRVANGQKATFTVDAWPDRSFTATVTKVAFGSAVTDNVVTYETKLEVSNEDLSLRPGMTATADIRVADGHDILLVPNAALRFDPEAAAAREAENEAPKKSFVQSITPTFRRRGDRGPRPDGGDRPAMKRTPGVSRIFVLRNGEPEPMTVKTGLTDGRFTEVSGEGVTEGLPVIVRALPPES